MTYLDNFGLGVLVGAYLSARRQEVIHAFGNADALTILQAIRQAAPPKATLLVIEQRMA